VTAESSSPLKLKPAPSSPLLFREKKKRRDENNNVEKKERKGEKGKKERLLEW
jgi:hypothetical protein